MLEQKVKAAWRAFIAAKDPSADVSERAWEDLHFTERNAWFSAFRAFVVPTDDPQSVQEPVMYQFRWTNPAGQQVNDPAIGWTRVEPRWNGTAQEKCAEILAHRYGEKPCYEVRALYTSPQAPQPLTKEQRLEVCARAEAAMQRDPNLSWREALMSETEAAHGIKE